MSKAFRTGTWTQGCSFCRGLKASVTNNLAYLYPELAKEWMTRKNRLRPEQVSFGSNLHAWWKCRKKGHIWQALVCARTHNGNGCPRCKGAPIDLRQHPNVLKEFDYKKNPGIDPFAIPDKTKIVWRCARDPSHGRWISSFVRTTHTQRCPSCLNRRGSKYNNLKITHPEIAKQWDKLKNGALKPEMVTEGSHKQVFWKCKEGPDHEWSTKVVDSTRTNTRCPFCAFRKTSVTNVLATLAPKLAKEWHPKKNGKVTPDNERARSKMKRWWICSRCSHEWQTKTHQRYLLDSGCPRCAKVTRIMNMQSERGIKSDS